MCAHCDRFVLDNIKFVLAKHLGHAEKNDLVLFDEYYHHVRRSTLKFANNDKFTTPFEFYKMEEERVLFGGHIDAQFKQLV